MLKNTFNSFFLIGFCLCVANAEAAGYLLSSEINASTAYTNNVNFSKVSGSSTNLVLTPKVQLNYNDDDWDTTSNARVTGTTYSGDLQNQLASYVDFGTAYKEERGIYAISTSYEEHNNRAEETNILGDSIDQRDTSTFSIMPKYTHLFTERLSLSLAYKFSAVEYGSGTEGSFFSYKTQDAQGSMGYKLDPRSELSLMLSAKDYASDNGASEYQILSSKIGIEHNFSEMVSAKMSVGVSDREFSDKSTSPFTFFGTSVTGVQELETTSSGTSFDASFDAKWVTLDASRDYVTNSFGGLNRTESVNAKFRMQVTPLVGLTLTMKRVKIDEINVYLLDNSQVATTISPVIKFSLAHNLSMFAKYTVGKKDIVSATRDDTSDYKTFLVNMKYIFPSI